MDHRPRTTRKTTDYGPRTTDHEEDNRPRTTDHEETTDHTGNGQWATGKLKLVASNFTYRSSQPACGFINTTVNPASAGLYASWPFRALVLTYVLFVKKLQHLRCNTLKKLLAGRPNQYFLCGKKSTKCARSPTTACRCETCLPAGRRQTPNAKRETRNAKPETSPFNGNS